MAIAKQNSVSVPNRRQETRRKKELKDARTIRTRRRIDAAFVELLFRRSYGGIRVSDITRKAGVGRATFYAHYAAKDDLLRSQFERGVGPMIIASPADPCLLDAVRFFDHVRNAGHIYKALMGPHAGSAPRVLRGCFESRARQALALDPGYTPGLKHDALARFVASSLITITECWLERGARETPQQVQALFASLVSPGVRTCRKSKS